MLDCIIVGSGPAGISAALTLRANQKEFMLFGQAQLSEKVSKAEKIENYPGLPSVSGQAFVDALKTQLDKANIPVVCQRVSGVYALGDKYGVATQEGGYYESKTVILACGVENIKTIPGEVEFLGSGVSYCATCDGFLYKDKCIAVLCTTKRMEHEVELLAGFAKKVHLVALYKDVEMDRENVEVLRKMPIAIEGDKRVESLVFANAIDENGNKLLVDGVFVLRESIAPTALCAGLTMKDGHVQVDRGMQTNLVGCYAVGDCTGKPYQYAKAVGEGNVAAHSVCHFLSKK